MTGLAEAFDRIGSFLEHRMPLLNAPGAARAVTHREETLGGVGRGVGDGRGGGGVGVLRPEHAPL